MFLALLSNFSFPTLFFMIKGARCGARRGGGALVDLGVDLGVTSIQRDQAILPVMILMMMMINNLPDQTLAW